MATINITFSGVSTAEARTANWALAKANEERAAQEPPQAAFANVAEMLEDHILNVMLPSWQVAEAAEDQTTQNAKALWEAATDAQRAAAIAALTA